MTSSREITELVPFRAMLERGRQDLAAGRLEVEEDCRELGVSLALVRALAKADAAADECGLALAELDAVLHRAGT